MVEFRSPSVRIRAGRSQSPAFPAGANDATVAAVIIAEKGPVGVKTRVTSIDETRKIYGDLNDLGVGMHWLTEFFQMSSGNGEVLINRIAHYTDPTDPTTLTALPAEVTLDDEGPGYSLSGSDPAISIAAGAQTFNIAISGEAAQLVTLAGLPLAGGPAIAAAIQTAVRGLTAVAPANQPDYNDFICLYTTDGRYLLINGTAGAGKTVVVTDALTNNGADDLNIGLLNGGTEVAGFVPTLKVKASSEGAWSNALSVTIEHVNKVNTALAQDLVNGVQTLVLESAAGVVTGSILAITDVTVPLNSPATIYVEVDRVANGLVYLKEPVSLTNTIEAGTTPAMVKSHDFRISVKDGTRLVETWDNLSMNAANQSDYCELVVNDKSAYIVLEDQDARTLPGNDRPAIQANTMLIGGDDGLTGLNDADFIGDAAARTGMRFIETDEDVNILVIPDRRTPEVHRAMQAFAEEKERFLFCPDFPDGLDRDSVITYVQDTTRLTSQWGWGDHSHLIATDPRNRDIRRVGLASAARVGIMARLASGAEWVHTPPGGETYPLYPYIDVQDTEMNDLADRDVVYPARINPVCRQTRGGPLCFLGVQTFTPGGTGGFSEIQKSATFLAIKRDVLVIVRSKLIRPCDADLVIEIDRDVRGYLQIRKRQGALVGATDEEAFDISFPVVAEDLRRGIVRGRVGVALVESFKFADIEIFEKSVSAVGTTV